MFQVLVLLFTILAANQTAPAQAAPERVALVVGTSEYLAPLKPLANPVRDARRIAEVLKLNGFAVTFAEDPDHAGFTSVVDRFTATSSGAKEAVIFFSGHGMAVVEEGKLVNALAPIDAEIDCKTRQARRVIRMEQIIERLAHIPKKVALFDACRNDPFQGCSGTSANGYGFREISISHQSPPSPGSSAPSDTDLASKGFVPLRTQSQSSILISYASDLGGLALDGEPGKHSPFAQALIDKLTNSPKMAFRELLDQTSQEVATSTNHFQVPWVVTKGGEPEMCLSGADCELGSKLRLDRIQSIAASGLNEALKLKNQGELYRALDTAANALEPFRDSPDRAPEVLKREFETLLVSTPQRRSLQRTFSLDKGDLIIAPRSGRIALKAEDGNSTDVLDGPTYDKVSTLRYEAGLWFRALSPGGEYFLACREGLHGRPTKECEVKDIDSNGVVKTFDLPEAWIDAGEPAFSPKLDFILIPYSLPGNGGKGAKIHVLPLVDGSQALDLAIDEEPLSIVVSADGDEFAALLPKRIRFFKRSGKEWQAFTLSGLGDAIGEMRSIVRGPFFGVDFDTKRLAVVGARAPISIIDYEYAEGQLVVRQSMDIDECLGCSILGLTDGGRRLVVAGLGTDGFIESYSLPLQADWSRIEKEFRLTGSALWAALLNDGRTAISADAFSGTLVFLDLDHHPIRRSFTIPGLDQIYISGMTRERYFVGHAVMQGAFVLDLKTERILAKRRLTDYVSVTGQQYAPPGIVALGGQTDGTPLVRIDYNSGRTSEILTRAPFSPSRAKEVEFFSNISHAAITWQGWGDVGSEANHVTIVDQQSGSVVGSGNSVAHALAQAGFDENAVGRSKTSMSVSPTELLISPTTQVKIDRSGRIVIQDMPELLREQLDLARQISGGEIDRRDDGKISGSP